MSDAELLPCFCDWGLMMDDAASKLHERSCPAYYREAVVEDKKKAVEAARIEGLTEAKEILREGGFRRCRDENGEPYWISIPPDEVAMLIDAAIRRIEGK